MITPSMASYTLLCFIYTDSVKLRAKVPSLHESTILDGDNITILNTVINACDIRYTEYSSAKLRERQGHGTHFTRQSTSYTGDSKLQRTVAVLYLTLIYLFIFILNVGSLINYLQCQTETMGPLHHSITSTHVLRL